MNQCENCRQLKREIEITRGLCINSSNESKMDDTIRCIKDNSRLRQQISRLRAEVENLKARKPKPSIFTWLGLDKKSRKH